MIDARTALMAVGIGLIVGAVIAVVINLAGGG